MIFTCVFLLKILDGQSLFDTFHGWNISWYILQHVKLIFLIDYYVLENNFCNNKKIQNVFVNN